MSHSVLADRGDCTDFSGSYVLQCYQENGSLYEEGELLVSQTGCEILQWGEIEIAIGDSGWAHDLGDVKIKGTDKWASNKSLLRSTLLWEGFGKVRTAEGSLVKLGDTILKSLKWDGKDQVYCLAKPK
jgi:hypothetical protein